jgi:type I restriction enzyme S subunit
MSEYPSDWTRTTFGNVLRQRKEAGFTNEELLAVTSSSGIVKRDSLERRDTSNEDKSKYLLVEKGDIAYNTMRMWQGVSGVSRFRGIVSPAYTICTPTKGLDGDFAGYLLKDPAMVSIFRQRSQGLVSDTWNLKYEAFAHIPCTIPPLPVQKKIAEILSGIDRQITLGRHSLEKLALLERATIKSAIDRIENIHSDCRQLTAGEICRKIFVGIASSTTHAYTDKTGVPMLRNQNIKLGTIDSADLVYINKDFAEEQKSKRLLKGDVITARTGYPGASAVVGREFEDCHSFTTLISRVETSIVIPEYYSLYLNSPQGKAQVAQLQAGGAQENLNVGALEKMIIPIPDLKTQISIVKASEELLKTYRAKKSVVRKCERLKEALSADLLSGRKRVSV